MTRKIKVAGWDHLTKEFTEIDVPHKPAEEVFKVEEAAVVKRRNLEDNDFLSRIGSTSIAMATVESVIEHINDKDVPDEVKREAVSLVESEA